MCPPKRVTGNNFILHCAGCPYYKKQHHMCKLVEKLVLFCILKTQGRYFVERHGSGVKLQTLDYENPGSNTVLQC
jgi:hypothetical protein